MSQNSQTLPLEINPSWTYDEDHSWHFLVCERASNPSIVEWMNGNWYSGQEKITPEEMYNRGWTWHRQVPIPLSIRYKELGPEIDSPCPTNGDLK